MKVNKIIPITRGGIWKIFNIFSARSHLLTWFQPGFLTNITVLLLGTGIMHTTLAATVLENKMLNSYVDTVPFQAPTATELQKAEQLFISILTSKVVKPTDATGWAALGFTLQQVTEGSKTYAVIAETNPQAGRGSGFYIIKLTGPSSQNVLEAPHRPSDLYTHQVIYKMLTEGNYFAGAWNTTNRSNGDLGKEVSSFFNAFTIAVAKALPQPTILQLHAFDAAANEIEGDVILSSTKKTSPAPLYNQIANCLKTLSGSLPYIILQFPTDVNELGGTLNINAKNFYQANANGLFFHVETSKPFRVDLRDNQIFRVSFSQCFGGY